MTNLSEKIREGVLPDYSGIRMVPLSLLPCALQAEFEVHQRVNRHNRAHGARVKWQGHRLANLPLDDGTRIPTVWEQVQHPEKPENNLKILHAVERVIELALEISMSDSQLNICVFRLDKIAWIAATVEPTRPDWETFKK
jgi:hypothetical protein